MIWLVRNWTCLLLSSGELVSVSKRLTTGTVKGTRLLKKKNKTLTRKDYLRMPPKCTLVSCHHFHKIHLSNELTNFIKWFVNPYSKSNVRKRLDCPHEIFYLTASEQRTKAKLSVAFVWPSYSYTTESKSGEGKCPNWWLNRTNLIASSRNSINVFNAILQSKLKYYNFVCTKQNLVDWNNNYWS